MVLLVMVLYFFFPSLSGTLNFIESVKMPEKEYDLQKNLWKMELNYCVWSMF